MPDRMKPTRIVITGRDGQVARALAERCAGGTVYELVHAARPQLNFEQLETLATAIAELEPDVVVNAAAYTAVDEAEGEPGRAMMINADAAGEVARGAALARAPVIQISTDYVFDGTLGRPYREDDPVSPLGVYGRTKLAGEEAVVEANAHHVILRTAWIYSPFGKNFVKTMLRLAAAKETLDVVADQVGNPTSALAIADAILAVAKRLSSEKGDDSMGIFHFAGAGSASWYELAKAIFEVAGSRLPNVPQVNAISTADYPTPARRPADSRLDTTRFEETFFCQAPAWRVSLTETLQRLV